MISALGVGSLPFLVCGARDPRGTHRCPRLPPRLSDWSRKMWESDPANQHAEPHSLQRDWLRGRTGALATRLVSEGRPVRRGCSQWRGFPPRLWMSVCPPRGVSQPDTMSSAATLSSPWGTPASFLGVPLHSGWRIPAAGGGTPVTSGENGGRGGGTHRARPAVEADQQQDLGHQDGGGQVGMDVVALVPDGANRAEGRGWGAGVRPSCYHSWTLSMAPGCPWK